MNTYNLTVFNSKMLSIGIAARKTAEKYSWDKIRNMYVDTWKSLLNSSYLPQSNLIINEKSPDSQSAKAVGAEKSHEKSPRIAVCTFYTPDFEYFAKYTTLNIRNYCNLHGYDYIEQTDNFIELSPKYPYIAWNKEVLLKKVLNIKNGDAYKYDWVFWIDSDIVITNKSIRLEDIINIAKDKSPNDNIVDGVSTDSTFFRMSEVTLKAISLENKQSQLAIDRQTVNNPNNEADIIVTKEESGCCVISAGIILVRNSEWSRKFIDNWLDKGELPGALWRDQDTFHYFYMGNEEVRKHVKVLKQKVMNSFPQIFSDGDFILHYAGKDRKDLKRLAYYGEKNYVSKRDDIPSLLNRLGLNGEGIEIGVQQGLYAEIILNNSNLKKLHLCDLWRQQDNKIYRSVANVCNDDQNKIFTEVENKFKNNPIYSNRTNILRMLSNDAVKLFKDCSLDFVYIDANHRYESILEDIKNWYPKVKAGGIIAGHDYLDGDLPEESFGVKMAVLEYFGNKDHISNNCSHVSDAHSSRDSDHCDRISNNRSHVSDRIYVTDEDWPSWYVITKN